MIRQQSNPVLVPDNKSGAYRVREKPNGLEYIDIDTVDGSEKIDFGNVTTNPEYNFLGSGVLTVNGGLTMAANSDIVLPATSELTLNGLTPNLPIFTDGSNNVISNAITGSGNVVMSASPTLTGTVSGASLTLSGSINIGATTTITGVLDDDTMSANSASALITQQSLVAYVGSEISSAVITDHGALTGLGDDDHAQYALVSGVRDFTGQVGINTTNPALYFKEGGVTKGSISESSDHLIINAVTNNLYLWAASDLIMEPTGDIEAEADIVLGYTYDLRGSNSSDIDWGFGNFTVSGNTGNTKTGELQLDASIPFLRFKNSGVTNGNMYTLSGGETYWYSYNNDITIIPNDTVNLDGHLSIMGNSDLLMSISSDILGANYSILGSTGNIVSSGSLTLGGTSTIAGFLDDDTMSANSSVHGVTQQSLVAYVGSEISSAVITDHGALTGLGDDDHTQYFLASGARSLSGNLNISKSVPQIWFTDGGTRGRIRMDSDILYLESYYSSVRLLASTFVNIQAELKVNGSWSIDTILDDDTMSANSSSALITQQSLVAYVGSEISSAVITDHGALTGLGDDDHTQYVLADGTRNITGPLIIDDILTLKHTNPITLFRNDSATLLGSVGNLAAGDMRLKCDTSHINIEASTYVAIQSDLYVNSDLTMGTGYDIIGTSSGFLDWAGDATIEGDFKTGGERGWTSGAQASLGAGQTTSSAADSNRDSVSGKSFITVTPSGSSYYYGLTGLVNNRYYTILNTGSNTASILKPSGTTTESVVLVGYARTFFYYGGVMYFDGAN